MAADLVAAVTAAGESTRMGGFPKPLLTFDGRRFVERLVDTYARVGVEPVVVLGHEASEVRARADLSDATVRENPAYERGMLSSVRVAVEYARQRDANGVLLNPVDCPLTPPAVVETVAATSSCRPQTADEATPRSSPRAPSTPCWTHRTTAVHAPSSEPTAPTRAMSRWTTSGSSPTSIRRASTGTW